MRARLLVALAALIAACGDGGGQPDSGKDASDAGDEPGVYTGPVGLMLVGTIVTPDTVIDGEVLVIGQTITCADVASVCDAVPEAAHAVYVQTGGVIAPGLIDTHNHVLFDIFDGDDWFPSKLYANHNQWPNEPKYAAMLDVKQCLANDAQGKPAWCANTPYGNTTGSLRCEIDKWGELKALIAGTTSMVGLPGTSSACFGSLTRSIDVVQNGLATDRIRTSATFPPSKATADSDCTAFAQGTADAFLIHCGEGTDATSLAEFATLGSVSTTPNCLYAPQTTITHGVAFTQTEFQTMASNGMKLTWSPASNVALYGTTADIPTALDAGVTIALAPDWSMGGSQNILDEMRFANDWDDAHWSNRIDSASLLKMTTTNAASVLGLSNTIGRIKAGMVADLVVVSGDVTKPYDAVVAATPSTVRLVVIGGEVLYGDADLSNLASSCETFDACGTPKFLCVARPGATIDKLDQTYTQIQTALEQGLEAADQQTLGDGFTFAPLTPLVKCP
jgi:cytosine/adenosine deaminase-related metal-dependent hydrolase